MPHPLQARVAAVRRKAVGLVRAHALSQWATALIVVVAAFALADYFLRLQDSGARWILSGLALGAVAWAAWRFVVPAMSYRTSLVQVASRIERVFPQLDHRLSSAMDFLAQEEGDKSAGSADLRRAVVAEAEALSADLDFNRAIDARRPSRALVMVTLATLVGGALILSNQHSAGLALSRLFMPWSDQAWPRRHTLEFVKRPNKIAVGDDFELELIDRSGRLPDNVQIQIRHSTPTGVRTESKDLKPLGERAIFRLDNVTQPLAYRARGGDDDTMPWTDLAVVEPPKVVALEIAVQPPAYTGLPREAAGRVVKAIAGSALAIHGRVDKPIVSATLKSETPGLLPPSAEIAPGGLSFAAPADPKKAWLVERSGAFWVELTDESGLPTGRDTRFEVQARADSPPTLSWESPSDHTFVTARALVPVKCLVKDDLAIRKVELRYLRPGISDEGELTVELFAGPAQVGRASTLADGDSRTIDYAWDLSHLTGLATGDVLAVRITADDYKPQLATSIVRRLTILTEEELEARLSQRQSAVLNQLAEALRVQRECREQLAALQIRLEEAGKFDESDLNHLQSAQLNQRQVEKLLGTGPEGVEGQIVSLLEELKFNRIAGQAVAERMNDLLGKVRQLNRQPLVEIGQHLSESLKAVRERMDGCGQAAAAEDELELAAGRQLQAAAARQDEVIQSLELLLGKLSEWDSFSRLAREIGQIKSDQQKLADETEAVRLKSAVSDPSAEERTTARLLEQQQLGLARRLDKIQGRMEEMLTKLTASDPVAAATLADALEAARRLAIGGRMRDAASRLGQQQFGPSHQTQMAVLEGLKQLLDLLSSRREDELARTIKSLRAAAGQVDGLLTRQADALREAEAAGAEENPAERQRQLQRLTKDLERLSQEIQELGRKLQRLQAPRAAAAMAQAGEQNAAGGQSAAAGDPDSTQESARTARQRLEEARQEIQQAIAQAEQELAQQMLARMEQWIKGLLARQKNVLAETIRLEAARGGNMGQLETAQQGTLKNVAAEQRLIADETEQLRLKLEGAVAFAFALEAARLEMQRAGALLQRGSTDIPVQQAEQSAANRLEQMLTALKPDQGSPPEAAPPDQPSPPMPPPGQKDPFSSLAELKLLQLMQSEINRRTGELEGIHRREGKLTDDGTQELDQLAQQQGRLAEMVFNLIKESAAKPEDDPDSLPDGNERKDAQPKRPTLDEQLLKELE